MTYTTSPSLSTSDDNNNYKITEIAPPSNLKELKLGTLNVWGLYVSKDRKIRMKAIADRLRESDCAVIGLQEVWVRKDYEYLAAEVAGTFPYSYYFKSGQMGSGMATFSKYPIKQAMFHRFLLNGQAHHIWHGDWWSGKGVGLTRIEISDKFCLNFYNTHLHAEYNKETNYYLGHRISQLQQLFQFVQMSSAVPESEIYMNAVAGDLNTNPECFSFDLFIKKDIIKSKLHDSASVYAARTSTEIPNTFNVTGNTYSKAGKPEQRIDYILFSGSETIDLKNFSVLSNDKLAKDGKKSLSDHCMVEATFVIDADPKTVAKIESEPTSVEEECALIKKTIAVLSKDMHYTRKSQKLHAGLGIFQLFLFLAVTIIVSLILTFDTLPLIVTLVAFIVAPGFLIGAILSGLIAVVWLPEEMAHLHGFASQWNLALMARGVETLPVTGIVDAMDANPEAIEQMCTITGQRFDKAVIKQILYERKKSLAATPNAQSKGKALLDEDSESVDFGKGNGSNKNSVVIEMDPEHLPQSLPVIS